MKVSSFKFFALLIIGIGTYVSSFAVSKYGTGKDSIECIKNLSLYSEYYKQNNYKDALKPWRAVFNNCPKASKNTFINGAKMYKEFISKENNSARKQELVDTLMLIYTRRIENFGQKGAVLGYQGADLLKYSPTSYEKAFEILKQSIEIQGKKSKANVVSGYFQAAVFKMKNSTLTQLQTLEIYTSVMEIIEYQLENGKEKSKNYYESAKASVEKLMIDDVRPDCETLVKLLQPKYDQEPNNVELLKKIINTLDKCDDTELYLNAVVNLEKLEPSAESSHNIAKMYYKKKDNSKAIEYYKKAISLETDNSKKAVLNYEMALITFSSNATSLSYANNAIALNPSYGDAYLLKAKLYASGKADCAKGNEQEAFLNKAIYWAVVDLCNLAKSKDASVAGEASKMIGQYSQYFPNNEEIFFQGMKEGDSFPINCWFSATTTVRPKK